MKSLMIFSVDRARAWRCAARRSRRSRRRSSGRGDPSRRAIAHASSSSTSPCSSRCRGRRDRDIANGPIGKPNSYSTCRRPTASRLPAASRSPALACEQHAVADEAGADADERGDLADLLRELHRGGDDGLRGLRAAHDLQQAHHVRRREEVQADDRLGTLGRARDLVHVQVRSIGRQDRALLDDAVELARTRPS